MAARPPSFAVPSLVSAKNLSARILRVARVDWHLHMGHSIGFVLGVRTPSRHALRIAGLLPIQTVVLGPGAVGDKGQDLGGHRAPRVALIASEASQTLDGMPSDPAVSNLHIVASMGAPCAFQAVRRRDGEPSSPTSPPYAPKQMRRVLIPQVDEVGEAPPGWIR
ncbi:hypothetical protein B2J93_4122 [Marssonina coronariae]|uniref:Uncharacterized protein n=1 Tax=Diplocarpon coronariae TaxID=2795749 RepID=A0A218YSP2_9HELO|nr:hypothetical protein B2J93_4122 [Marssonina coronariae]